MTVPLALGAGIGLGLLALILVGPGPVWVARWPFLLRVPRAAVVLWQAGSLGAMICVLGAAALVIAQVGDWRSGRPVPVVVTLLLSAFAGLVLARLGWSLIRVARETAQRRSRHRTAVDLLSTVDADLPVAGLRVIAEQLPIAYCLPGLRRSRVVLSAGTLAVLDPAELAAVLAHEEAHVRARHDIVLDSFVAVQRAFPHAIRSELPVQQCRLLVEMLADDAARKRTGDAPLARALVALAGSAAPGGALGLAESGLRERVDRLTGATPGWSRPLAVAVYALAATLVLGPVAAIVVALVGSSLL